MGNNQSSFNNEPNQRLLNNNSQVHDTDVSLMINDQPQIKQICAIKNPVYLKRNTLALERDSNQRNLFYVQFTYDALVDMKISIYFNAERNPEDIANSKASKKDSKKKSKDNSIEVSGESLLVSNNSTFNTPYIPGKNFKDKVLKFYNCPRGQNKRFFDKNAAIDITHYNANKEDKEEGYDIVIEFSPIFNGDISNMNRNNLNSSSSDNDIYFFTLCKVYSEENSGSSTNVVNPPYRIKTELQRLKVEDKWYDIYEVYNSALESGECLICCHNPRNTIFLPCKHSCSCQTCAHSLRMRSNPCPICKNSIDDLVIVETEESNVSRKITPDSAIINTAS